MTTELHERTTPDLGVRKCPTGITGLDEITDGGLPQGRPTLVCGSAGCGKTLLAMEFLVRGATQFGQPGVFMSFEETDTELKQNVRSLGFDLQALVEEKKVWLDFVRVERSEIEEAGEYDLEGLFVRLGYAIDSVGANRVVLDTIETLFSAFTDQTILRAELRRLFRWLKTKQVTAIITGERGNSKALTRNGIEEYVSDCVISLDHRVEEQISTRRLRVVKYRGTTHGTNEYPFVIDNRGISLLPVTSLGLEHEAPRERVSTGIEQLDAMLGGRGIHRGSSALVSGTAGTGKTSFVAHFVDAACRRGEKCAYFAFEESPRQIMRNMESIGLDLQRHVDSGLLCFQAMRPTIQGLELHLSGLHRMVEDFVPDHVVLDPVTNLTQAGTESQAHGMLLRLIDYLKSRKVTAWMTTLTGGGEAADQTDVGISSLIDTWLLLRNVESSSERNRGLFIIKSRGTGHSNQVREYRLSERGIELLDVYVGPGGTVTGSARLAQEAKEKAEEALREQEFRRKQVQMEAERRALEAQMAALQAKLTATEQEMQLAASQEETRRAEAETNRAAMARIRHADTKGDGSKGASREQPPASRPNR